MATMMNLIRSFVRDEKGEDLIEYGLLAAFVAAVGILALFTNPDLRNAIVGAFTRAADALNNAGA
jgi:Flp pilus assembly pilin Flp